MNCERELWLLAQPWKPHDPKIIYRILVHSLAYLTVYLNDNWNVFYVAHEMLLRVLGSYKCPLTMLSSLSGAIYSLASKQAGANETIPFLNPLADIVCARLIFHGVKLEWPNAKETLSAEIMVFQLLDMKVPVQAGLIRETYAYLATARRTREQGLAIFKALEIIVQQAATPAFFAMPHRLFVQGLDHMLNNLGSDDYEKIYANVLYLADMEYARANAPG